MKAADIADALGNNIQSLALHLLGDPNREHSSKIDWRYGRKGSFSIVVDGPKRGSCYDHEEQKGGDALWFVQRCRGGTCRDAMDFSVDWLGKAPEEREPVQRKPDKDEPELTDPEKTARALQIFDQGVPLAGTIGQTYFESRRAWPGIELEDIRFHPFCPFGKGRKLPCIVALMRNIITNEPQAIHRTAILPDGSDKDERWGLPKKMFANALGTAIKLFADADVTSVLSLAEGLENGLSVARFGWIPIWVAGSSGAIGSFPVLPGVEALHIFADNDERKRRIGLAKARECAAIWQGSGREARIHLPPEGLDWNDVVRRRAA